MKSLKLIGLALMAVFALGAFAASASAEEGFLVGGEGTPKTATLLGGKAVLETSQKSKIECTKVDDTTLTFTNDKTATSTLLFLGCTSLGLAANSEGDAANTILVPVKFLVCLDTKNAAGTLTDEFGIAGEVVGTLKLKVPAAGIGIEVKGTALGAVLTKGSATLFNVEFAGSGTAGEQAVASCLQGTTTITHNLLANFNKVGFELANEKVEAGLVQFEKATELMDS